MPIYELDGEAPDLPPAGQYYIADSAVVIGRVRLATDVSLWFGAVLRGDNEWIEVGERTNVQDNATLHTDPGFPLFVGRDCTIGHNAILHGCIIGDNTLIGMGAVLLNGAKVGSNCLVGAGALVPPGREYPDNSVIVGSPARQLRAADEKTVKFNALSADIYVRRGHRYRGGLKRIG